MILSGRVLLNFLRSHKVSLVYIPLAVYWVVLFIATSIPADRIPEVGVGDKFSHFFAYAVLSALLFFTFSFQEKFSLLRLHPAKMSVLISTIYGALDELHQMLIPGRSAEVLDWIADFVGAVAGVLVVKFVIDKFGNNK